jgi:uncharacterized protein
VLDTRELGRRPGTMQRVRREVPAPGGLAVALVGVPEGSPVRLELRLESVVEGVLVSGAVDVALAGECARCLDPFRAALRVDLLELFSYAAEEPVDPDADRPLLVEDERIDLGPVLHDAVVLALPLAPVCSDDCPGLCPDCGARLADTSPGHAHGGADPRWAALAPLLPAADPPGRARIFPPLDPSGRSAVGRAEEN